jgi:hypothetical protein
MKSEDSGGVIEQVRSVIKAMLQIDNGRACSGTQALTLSLVASTLAVLRIDSSKRHDEGFVQQRIRDTLRENQK